MNPSRLAAILGVATQAVGAYQRSLITKREDRAAKDHAKKVMAEAPSIRAFHSARGERIGDVAQRFIDYAYRMRRKPQARVVCNVVRSRHNPSVFIGIRYILRGPVRPYLAE